MARDIRTLNMVEGQKIESDLVVKRIGDLSYRNLGTFAKSFLFDSGKALIVGDGLRVEPDSGMTVKIPSGSVFQRFIDIIPCLQIEDQTVTVEAATGSPRIDIIEAQIKKISNKTDYSQIATVASGSAIAITNEEIKRDIKYYLDTRSQTNTTTTTSGTKGKLTGTIDLTSTVDLTEKYLINIADGEDSSFQEIDCRGSSPSATTRLEIINAINSAVGRTMAATGSGNVIELTGAGTGETSFFELKAPVTDPDKDCLDLILGLSIGGAYKYTYQGENEWFKLAEIDIGAATTVITSGLIRNIDQKSTWASESNDILIQENINEIFRHIYLDKTSDDLILESFNTSDIKLKTNNTERMVINSNGWIGIGTTNTPTARLHIHENSGSAFTAIRVTNNDTGTGNADGFMMGINSDESAFVFNNENTSLIFGTNATQRLKILENGNIAIGAGITTTPDPIEVYKNNSNPSYMRFTNSTTGQGNNQGTIFGIASNEDAYIVNFENTSMLFYTDAQERFRITNDGKLATGIEGSPDCAPGGITLKGDFNFNTAQALTIKNINLSHTFTGLAEADTGLELSTNDSGNTVLHCYSETTQRRPLEINIHKGQSNSNVFDGGGLEIWGFNRSGAGRAAMTAVDSIMTLRAGVTGRYYFGGDGTAQADVTWSTFSDKRLKKEGSFPYGLKDVLKLTPKKYTRFSATIDKGKIKKEPGSSREEIGFFAQDVYEIIPEVCIKPKNENESFWCWDDRQLTPVLVKAIKEIFLNHITPIYRRIERIERKISLSTEVTPKP